MIAAKEQIVLSLYNKELIELIERENWEVRGSCLLMCVCVCV